MVELAAKTAGILDVTRPRYDQRIARAAQMRCHLLAPLEGSVGRPRPGRGIVVHEQFTAKIVGVLQSRFNALRFAVYGVSVDSLRASLRTGAIVTGDVEDDSVFRVPLR